MKLTSENMSVTDELEKIKKKYEKVKSSNANLKINHQNLEQKMKSQSPSQDYLAVTNENSILRNKIGSLSKENNELKHRINKLLNTNKLTSSSRGVKNRIGSNPQKSIKK